MKTKELDANETKNVAGGTVQKSEKTYTVYNVYDKDSGAEFKGFKNEQTAKFLDEAWNLIPLEKRKSINKKRFDSNLSFIKGMTPEDYAEQFLKIY